MVGCGVLPVNCIASTGLRLESQELLVLEFLARPQPKVGHGVFGGGWERPRNVFAAAKNFAKKLEREEQELEQEQFSRSPNGDAGRDSGGPRTQAVGIQTAKLTKQ